MYKLRLISKENLQGKRLFYDLDGVFADFDGHFPQTFGVEIPNDNQMWKMINDHGEFFSTMPLFPDSKDFFEDTKHLDPIFLTAASKSNYHHIAKQKRQWTRIQLTTQHLILPVPSGKDKPLFMHAPGDVLIDDHLPNIEAWNAAGGFGILHRDFEETSQQLYSYILKG